MTPNTAHNSTPDNLNPILRLTMTTGPVKSLADAKSYLEQRLLIALENNFNLDRLANLLVSMSLDPKIPDQAMNIIRAVALLMVCKIHNTFADDIVAVVADKLHTPTNLILKQLNHEKEFQTASGTIQANLTQQLQGLFTASNTMLQHLETTTTSLDHTLNMLTPAGLDPVDHTSTNWPNPFTSIAEPTKTLAKLVEDIKVSMVAVQDDQLHQAHTPDMSKTYAKVVAANTHCSPSSNQSTFNPDTLEHITHIENKLHIQERQVYVTFDQNTDDSPKVLSGTAAYTLGGKLNKWMHSLDQEAHQVLQTTNHLIKMLSFTGRGTILIECDSNSTVERLKSYFNKKDLLPHICSTVKGQPRPYRLVLKFIPCNGSFSPANEDHLHSLEVDHGIEEGSIIAASWIKKPDRKSVV